MIKIEHCRLRFECTQTWAGLEPLPGNPRVRYCSHCQSAVHLVNHEKELAALARQGKCVAVETVTRMLLGRPMYVDEDESAPVSGNGKLP